MKKINRRGIKVEYLGFVLTLMLITIVISIAFSKGTEDWYIGLAYTSFFVGMAAYFVREIVRGRRRIVAQL
ncbi:MAG: hypothetical protein Q8Q92_04420 [bacterium]|nr:hypothetical protein [bacterium]